MVLVRCCAGSCLPQRALASRHGLYTFTTEFLFNTVEILPWEVWNYILYVAVISLLGVPVCTYIAILRYKLYDIDLLINRTLVYGPHTVRWAGVPLQANPHSLAQRTACILSQVPSRLNSLK
jgi:hypothetical protein